MEEEKVSKKESEQEKSPKEQVGVVGKNIFFIDIFECYKCGRTIYKEAYSDENGYLCQKCAWDL